MVELQGRILAAFGPRIALAIDRVAKALSHGVDGGLEQFPSAAIGLVEGSAGNEVKSVDFFGPCICYSVGGSAGPGNAGIFLLFFGLRTDIFPFLLNDPLALVDLMRIERKAKGVAIISAASVSVSIPGLGAGATIFFGEIS